MMNIAAVLFLLSLSAGTVFAAGQGELKEYQSAWCERERGALFHALDDVSLVGCLTSEHAVVFAFGQQWEDAMGQAISFSARMGREPAIVLILEEEGSPYLEPLNSEAEKYHLKVWTMRPADLHQAETEVPATPVKQGKADGFEIYIGFFGGAARFSDSQATATTQDCNLLFGCSPPVTASENVSFGKGGVSGLRLGMWGGKEVYQYLGFAVEYSNTAAETTNSPDGANYNSFAFMPMVRIPFFKTDSMPGGRLNLYGGAGISRDSGRISIYTPALPRSVSGDAEGSGNILLIGAALKFSYWSLFIEMRKTDTSLSISSSGSFPGGNQDSGSISYETKQTIVGVTYRIGP